jgi:hypothetical protein
LATKDDLRGLRNQLIIAMGVMLAGYSTLVFAILSYANR